MWFNTVLFLTLVCKVSVIFGSEGTFLKKTLIFTPMLLRERLTETITQNTAEEGAKPRKY